MNKTRRIEAIDVPLNRLRLRDLLNEIAVGVTQRPRRSLLTALGTLLGVGVLVATIGITTSARAAVNASFDPVAASEVSARYQGDGVAVGGYGLLPDAEQRMLDIEGVTAAGISWAVPNASGGISLIPGGATSHVPVVAATPNFLGLAGAQPSSGVLFNDWHQDTCEPVALLGPQAVRSLSLVPESLPTYVWLDGQQFLAIGAIGQVERHPELLTAIVVTTCSARAIYGDTAAAEGSVIAYATVETGAAPRRRRPTCRRPEPRTAGQFRDQSAA
ncbi:MAG: ABC transporter permease [Arachnia sp.]